MILKIFHVESLTELSNASNGNLGNVSLHTGDNCPIHSFAELLSFATVQRSDICNVILPEYCSPSTVTQYYSVQTRERVSSSMAVLARRSSTYQLLHCLVIDYVLGYKLRVHNLTVQWTTSSNWSVASVRVDLSALSIAPPIEHRELRNLSAHSVPMHSTFSPDRHRMQTHKNVEHRIAL